MTNRALGLIRSKQPILQWWPRLALSFLARNWRVLLFLSSIAVAVGQSIWLPIYPDEVANRIALERFFLSGGYVQSNWAICANFLVRPPASLTAASMGWALLDELGIGFWSYRLMPISCIAMIAAVLLKLRSNDKPLLFLLVMTLGPIIYGIAILRPEVVLLAAYVGLFFSLSLLLEARSPWLRYIWLLLDIFGFSFVAFAHPKALYLFPLVLICIFAGARGFLSLFGKILSGAVFAGTASLVAIQATRLHLFFLSSCSQVPALSIYYQHQAVNIFDAIGNRSRFLNDLSNAFRRAQLTKLIQHVTYRGAYDLSFLPAIEVGGWEKLTNTLILAVLAATFLYAAARIVCGVLSRCAFEDRIRFLFLGFALATTCFTFATNLNKNFYDCSLFIGSLACIAALAETVPLRFSSPSWVRSGGFAVLGAAIILGSLLSACLNMRDFTLKFASGHSGPSVIDFKAQGRLAAELDDAMKRHGIGTDKPVVVDDQTYGILRKHPATLPVTYLLMDHGALLAAATKKQDAEYGAFYCTYLDDLKGVAAVEILEKIIPRAGVIPTCLVSFAPAWNRD